MCVHYKHGAVPTTDINNPLSMAWKLADHIRYCNLNRYLPNCTVCMYIGGFYLSIRVEGYPTQKYEDALWQDATA